MAKVIAINEEYIYHGNAIVSQTNLEGIITYANRAFCEISGYSIDELIGQPHKILRHPEMPKMVFTKMWESIQSTQTWNGLIKNLRSDGKFYWVETEILPILNEKKRLMGFISVRKEASRKDINETILTYNKMLETQK